MHGANLTSVSSRSAMAMALERTMFNQEHSRSQRALQSERQALKTIIIIIIILITVKWRCNCPCVRHEGMWGKGWIAWPQQPAALHATDYDMRSQQSLSYSRNFPRHMAPTITLPLSQQQQEHIGSLPNLRTRSQFFILFLYVALLQKSSQLSLLFRFPYKNFVFFNVFILATCPASHP